jgi:mono/diheme cytochrome c family protein
MNRRAISAIVGIAIVMLVTDHPGAQPQTAATGRTTASAPAGDAVKGKALFVKNGCFQCHNYEGHGGAAGARLAPNPIPFRGFLAYVRAPRGEMPPYTAKVMSDQELADVYAFLQSRPRPTPVGNIPLLAR